LVNYEDKYTEMHGQQNIKKKIVFKTTLWDNITKQGWWTCNLRSH